jgi:hypothetical protein
MASEILSLLQHGWENLWKNRVIWLFSSLVLIYPLLRLIIPMERNANLALSLLNIVINLAAIYFTFTSLVGISVVAYCIAIGNPVDWNTAFQESQYLLGRVIVLSFVVLLVLIVPFGCIVAFFFWQFLNIKNISHNIFFAAIPLSILSAMLSFPITETIKNNTSISKSLKAGWAVFTHHFVSLAIVGFLLMIGLRVLNISVSMAAILVEHNFDVSALSKLDFISPLLSFPNNNFYNLIVAIPQAIWQTYSASVFTFAYLNYSGAKMRKQRTP